MTDLLDCTDPESSGPHLSTAVEAIQRGDLVVFPTDTVYGVGADAFTADAVMKLLNAKGRDRQKPPPVLINDPMVLDALAVDISPQARALARRFWPGPLTLILQAQPSLVWDLGETRGTVALRVPDDLCARALLERTGPLAVSSANKTGEEPALTCAGAQEQLEDSVAVYLDGGITTGQIPSTIIDCTSEVPKILREGAIDRETLAQVVPSLAQHEEPEESEDPEENDVEEDDVKEYMEPTTEVVAEESDTDNEADPA